jgi:hypothetical protein
LIVSSAIPIKGAAVFLGERRRDDGGGKNDHSTESFHVGHLSSPLLRVSANALTAIWVRNPPTPLNCISFGVVAALESRAARLADKAEKPKQTILCDRRIKDR